MPDAAGPTGLRRAGSACALLATLPLATQLPPSLLALIGLLQLCVITLPKPSRTLTALVLLVSLALLLLAFNGRFGRDTAAGMLAVMLTLKCLEIASMRDLYAVLGFSLFLPFAAMLSSQEPLTFALSLLSLLCWLHLMQCSSTGQLRMSMAYPARLLKSLSRQVLMALPLTIALFWLFPRLATPLWGLPGLANARGGLGDTMTPGQWLDSLVDDRIAFRASFSGPAPAPAQRYWRGPVLWDFDGKQWRRQAWDSLPVPFESSPVADGDSALAYSVRLEPTERRYLPVLDWPRSAQAPYFLTQEASLYSERPIQKLTTYQATSWPARWPGAALSDAQRRRALALPDGLNPRSIALARQWRRESVDERTYIERVLRWIGRDFSYTLAVEEPGLNAVDEFLFEQKQGYCQHFSSAFAVLMRAAGIPARVVTGYAGGYQNPYGGYWVLYQKDAHAWNEVWLDGAGWTRIDPTAAVAPENILDALSVGGSEQYYGERPLFSPLMDMSDFMQSRWNDWVIGFNAARQADMLRGIGAGQLRQWQLLLALALLAALTSYAVFHFWRSRKPLPADPVEAAWRRLMSALERYGIGKMAHETANGFAARFPAGLPFSDALREAARHYSRWRYGHPAVGAQTPKALADTLDALARQVGRTKP